MKRFLTITLILLFPLAAMHARASFVDTLTVDSKMGRKINNIVITPVDYENHFAYPTVYLLHGYDGNYTDWMRTTNLVEQATKHQCIIVCPDGQDSWYFDSPIDPKMQFETYITKELIPAVDSKYNTIADRTGRAITGLSMGGHGALWIAWRHTDLFAACGSMSGGVDITKFPDKWKIQLRLGPYAKNKSRWASHSVASLVPTLKNGTQAIIIDDGADDFFYDVNMALHESLRQNGIDHEFDIRPGRHTWDYWTTSLPIHLDFFDKYLHSRQTSIHRAA